MFLMNNQCNAKHPSSMFPQNYRVVFLTGPPLKMSLDLPPPKMPRLAPPCFGKVLSMAAEKGEIPNTLTFSIPMGGQSGTLMFFLIQLLTGQHLANSGEAQLKKTPCINYDCRLTFLHCRYASYIGDAPFKRQLLVTIVSQIHHHHYFTILTTLKDFFPKCPI